MNSLAYLSRQFDVLASAKTPPSTPTTERPPNSSEPSLQRVSTWSTKSLLFPPPSILTGTPPKRSFSSPTFAALHNSSSSPSTASHPSPDLETQSTSESHVQNVLERIFFIRVFLLVWDNLRAAWLSLWRSGSLQPPFASLDVKLRNVGQVKSEGGMIEIYHPEIQQITTSPPTPLPSHPNSDPIVSSDLKEELHQPPPKTAIPFNVTLTLHSSESPASSSRSPTPILAARKTPFHLPKTLVLDLDETLIHSTSRPLNSFVSGGSGFFGLGSFNGRNKGTSHMVEVVLGGRSTLYHVYKRPFVDFFLRTVCRNLLPLYVYLQQQIGLRMVHTRDIHSFNARICGPSDRLAGCRSRYS